MPYKEIDLTSIRTYEACRRASKVGRAVLGKAPWPGMSFHDFLEVLPNVLRANEIKSLAKFIIRARELGKPIIAMIGGHVIKTGCGPILADLAEHGYITHLASNGSAAIHDAELALCGQTSEDVDAQLDDGSFGMAADTAALINGAAERAARHKHGFGQTIGAMLIEKKASHQDDSLSVCFHRLSLPYTVHMALGTDIVHQHPSANGADIGESVMRDFRIFCTTVSQLGQGGVVLNFGSAVIMPEVFLKALSVTRNLGYEVSDFTTANLDMIQHYRPTVNVVQRPVRKGGQGYALTGHHEIMIPLLAAMIRDMDRS